MNINLDDHRLDDIQEYNNIRTLKNFYTESQIPDLDISSDNLNQMQVIKKLYSRLPELEKAMKKKSQKYIIHYFRSFARIIQNFKSKDSLDCIKFIFPYIIMLINIKTHEEILEEVLFSLHNFVSNSQYYAYEFINSPAYDQLLLIMQRNITDFITGISINIIITLSHYEELHDIFHSIFSIQSIVDNILSDDYNELSKEGFILLLGEYLFEATDDEIISQILSYILKCLIQPNLKPDLLINLLYIVGHFYYQNREKPIDLLPLEMIQFISNHVYEIIKFLNPEISFEIFYLIYFLTVQGVVFNYPVEDIYQIVLNENTKKSIKDRIIEMLTISIKVCDDINYSTLFITKSIKEIIEYCLEDGTIKTKYHSLILIGIILSTNNLELFISILHSSAFANLLDFIEDNDDIDTIVIAVGILGLAFDLLQTMIPDSDEFKFFISSILSTDIIEQICFFSEQYDKYNELLMCFCSLIKSNI